jgi:hypothetical protein
MFNSEFFFITVCLGGVSWKIITTIIVLAGWLVAKKWNSEPDMPFGYYMSPTSNIFRFIVYDPIMTEMISPHYRVIFLDALSSTTSCNVTIVGMQADCSPYMITLYVTPLHSYFIFILLPIELFTICVLPIHMFHFYHICSCFTAVARLFHYIASFQLHLTSDVVTLSMQQLSYCFV